MKTAAIAAVSGILAPFLAAFVAGCGPAPPAPVCDARLYGAAGDGVTLDTAAIQSAIDACAGSGGRVVLGPGTYLSGTLLLGSKMTFRLEAEARLLGSEEIEDYSDTSLLKADRCRDLTIEGPGTVDGNGPIWWFAHWLDNGAWRPHPMIRLAGCQDVIVRDLRLEQSPGWNLHLLGCDRVLVERVTIRAPAGTTNQSPNTDGIDIDACRHVEVRDCDIETGDDCIVVKNSNTEWARESYDIDVHDCVVAGWANGFKIGTRPHAPVHDVSFRDSLIRASVETFPGTRVMGGVTLVADDGADVYDVLVENLRMEAVLAPFFLRVQQRLLDDEGGRMTSAGRLYGITLRDITVDDAKLPGMILGIADHPVEDVTIERFAARFTDAGVADDRLLDPPERNLEYPDSVYFGRMPAYGLYARHVAGPLRLRDVSLLPAAGEPRAAVVLDDVAAAETGGLDPGAEVVIRGE